MSRILSALVLLPIVIGTIWWLHPLATLVLAEVVLTLAFVEYLGLVEKLGARIPRIIATAAALTTCAAFGSPGVRVEGILMAATITVSAVAVGSGRRGREVLLDVSATLFALLYLALPVGALVAVRVEAGAAVLLLLIATVMLSDTAQYYGGRALGRRLLAPTISPSKTVEGAMAGFVAGTIGFVGLAQWALPGARIPILAALGLTIVALGIVGDLFESALKRGAGVKDASALIPGHGGMMDRIDGLLFATPVYYVFIRFADWTSVP